MLIRRVIEAILFSTSEVVGVKDLRDLIRKYVEQKQGVLKEGGLEVEEREVIEEELRQVPLKVSEGEIRGVVEELKRRYEENLECVYCIVEEGEGYRLMLKGGYGEWVRMYRGEEGKVFRWTTSVMETLALIAYRQPVTRAEMELIRGVGVDGPLNRLLEMDLVEVVGQANLPGRPKLYGTTERFLEVSGIKALEELPESDVIDKKELEEWLKGSDGNGYRQGDLNLV